MSAKPTIIFDFGRVLGLDQNAAVVESMVNFLGAERTAYTKAYSLLRDEYDRGTLSDFDYWGSVAAALGRQIGRDEVDALVKMDVESWFSTNRDMFALVERLNAEGYRLFILSNMNVAGRDHLVSRNEWGPYFMEMLFSCNLGMIKPEKAIYQYCLERTGAEAKDCIFIDDTPTNVQAAQACGMYGIVFKGYEKLMPELTRRIGLWSES